MSIDEPAFKRRCTDLNNVEKREGNLNKRIKEKKEKKMKKLVAKGRHVPGF